MNANADQFGDVLLLHVPPALEKRFGEVYFDATSQLYEAIATETPVDTGYLRAGLGIVAEGSTLPKMPERDPHAGKNSYSGRFVDAGAAIAGVAAAIAKLAPISLVFRAEYATEVEDRVHMVKRAKARWNQFVKTAIDNAKD